jgi:hypothetical protein
MISFTLVVKMVAFTIRVLIDWRSYVVSKCLWREKFTKNSMKWQVVQSPNEDILLLRTILVSSNLFHFTDQYKLLED